MLLVYGGTPFLPKMWPFKRVGLSSGVDINNLVSILQCLMSFPEGLTYQQGGPSKEVHCMSISLIYTELIGHGCKIVKTKAYDFEQNTSGSTTYCLF